MRQLAILVVLLSAAALHAQDTITVDAGDVMYVCSDAHPAAAGPCATPPRLLNHVQPVYPNSAREAHLEGDVVLSAVIGDDGFAHDITVAKSLSKDLDDAAIAAAKQWKFDPGTYQGRVVSVRSNLQIRFGLNSTAGAGAQSSSSTSEQVGNLFSDAQAAYNRHQYQTAADLARRITTLAPQANGWNVLGMSLFELDQPDAAIAALQTQIKMNPADPWAYNNLGRVYWRQHKYDEAAAQFQKQIVVNAQDQYAHANLGMMLRDAKKCERAIPELQKALAITPNHATALLALGECDIELGNNAKGLSEIEQATSTSTSGGLWNSAAYILARHDLDLDRARKWVETAITINTAHGRDITLEHLSPSQLALTITQANYWDTLGWVLFKQGKTDQSEPYVRAAWFLRPVPVVGSHLAQIYEKLGRQDDAIHMYTMTVASADLPKATQSAEAPEAVASAQQRLVELSAHTSMGTEDLDAMLRAEIPIAGHASGNADFAVKVSGDKIVEARRISGDAVLDALVASLQSVKLSVAMPDGVELPRRGDLHCKPKEQTCRFVLLTAQAAFDRAIREADNVSESQLLAKTSANDPRVYESSALGMHLSLLDGWALAKEEKGSLSHPQTVWFGKAGTLAYLVLVREHLESTPDLYAKMLDGFFSRHDNFRRTEEKPVTRDGVAGTRWKLSWTEKAVPYSGVIEFFTVGDEHYRIMSLAPEEVYGRYAENFEDMIRSIKFPMLHVTANQLDELR